jgi:predicted DNA-binding transcriptional regulator AlpA
MDCADSNCVPAVRRFNGGRAFSTLPYRHRESPVPTRLLSSKTVAAQLDVSQKTLFRMVKDGRFPAPAISLTGTDGLRWFKCEVDLWVLTHRIATPVKAK